MRRWEHQPLTPFRIGGVVSRVNPGGAPGPAVAQRATNTAQGVIPGNLQRPQCAVAPWPPSTSRQEAYHLIARESATTHGPAWQANNSGAAARWFPVSSLLWKEMSVNQFRIGLGNQIVNSRYSPTESLACHAGPWLVADSRAIEWYAS